MPNSGKPVDKAAIDKHREEVAAFARKVKGDEVKFVHCSYSELLECWRRHTDPKIRAHAERVIRCFCL